MNVWQTDTLVSIDKWLVVKYLAILFPFILLFKHFVDSGEATLERSFIILMDLSKVFNEFNNRSVYSSVTVTVSHKYRI